MTMRVFKLLLVSLLAASVLLLPGLGLAKKQTIVYGTTQKVDDLDPATQYTLAGLEYLSNCYPTLLTFKPGTTELIPDLALSYTASADNKEWTFKLREGIKWPDGTPFDAKAVKHSIDRAATLEGPPSWLVTTYVERMEVVSQYEVKFVLKRPLGYFPYLLPHTIYMIVNPSLYPIDEAVHWPTDLPGGKIEALGPFNMVSFKRDEEIVFEANPDYFGQKPKTDRIVIRFYADATTMRIALEKGEVDFAFQNLNPIDIKSLEESGKFKVWRTAAPYIRELVFCNTLAPVDDPVIRQAIAAAIDRDPIIKKVYLGQMRPSYSFMPIEWVPYYIPAYETKYGADGNLEMAKELLASKGYTPEKKLVLELWYSPTIMGDMEIDLAIMLKAQLEATGAMEVKVQSAEWASFIQKWQDKEMPAFLLGFFPDFVDPDACLSMASTEAGSAFGLYYSNEEWDAKLVEAASISDVQKRKAIYDWLQQEWAKENPMMPLFQGDVIAISKPDIEGLEFNAIGSLFYQNIHRVE